MIGRRKVLWITVNVFGSFLLLTYFYLIKDEFSSRLSLFLNNESDKIDWNDYELMKSDEQRTGFGEHGKGEKLTNADEIRKDEEMFKTFGMSVVRSEKISVNRSIPDFRHPECLKKKYARQLPRVSIVIIFNNEIFSVFKRTLHSLFNRTPHELIEEVILVNDNSTFDHLYDPLKNYIKSNFAPLKFKIIDLETRQGLMKARKIGVKAAKSEFIFMMEPHCEMTYNWLPPLIEPLIDDMRTVTVPIIDNIEYEELIYYENDRGNTGSRGVFDWKLNYQKLKRFPINEEKLLDPFPTPIMTGGIFLIRKKYFLELGPYDEELLIWGSENLEMSFKINLCGGKLLEVPCSRIGHVFRAFTLSRKHESGIDFKTFNMKRVVEVWFDEFKDFVYEKKREKFNNLDVGDLSKAKSLREKLNCKPFKYFLDVIAPDLLQKFPLETPPFAYGKIKLLNEDLCLEAPNKPEQEFHLTNCREDEAQSQNFELSWHREIRLKDEDLCMDFYKALLSVCKL